MSSDPIPIVRLARPAAGPATTKTAANIMLGQTVKNLREAAGLTQKMLAQKTHVSTPTISRLETAENTPQRRTVEAAMTALKVDGPTRDQMIVLLARAEEPEWFQHRFSDLTPDYLKRLLGLESVAIAITLYDARLISGLLQTPEYSRCIIRTGLHLTEWDGPGMELRLAQRMQRQERVLAQAEPPRCVFLLDQSVLMRRVGPDEVMYGQMVHLRELADLPHITIRFVLLDGMIAGNEASMAGSMAHIQFGRGGLPDLIYAEGYGKADYFTKPSLSPEERARPWPLKDNDYERHLQLLLRIQGEACASPVASRHLLDEAIKRFS